MEILEIAIVGTILSGLVSLIKSTFGIEGWQTKAITIGLAVVLGALIFFFSGTTWWQSMLGVLAMGSTVYAFLLK